MNAVADLRRARDLACALDVPRFRDDALDVVLTASRTGERVRALAMALVPAAHRVATPRNSAPSRPN
ncbi:hypothetical protein [Amycolatopsis sp. NPDC003731]